MGGAHGLTSTYGLTPTLPENVKRGQQRCGQGETALEASERTFLCNSVSLDVCLFQVCHCQHTTSPAVSPDHSFPSPASAIDF